MKKILSIVGARPNFIKLAAIHEVLEKSFTHVIVHTGQHYDYELSQHFFDELTIPEPDYNLHTGSATHGILTARVISGCEKILLSEKPNIVVVYGDTNSTLGGALAVAKLEIPIVHVESGLRSFHKNMPEEINRIVTDHISEVLLCPSELAVKNLKTEGITKNVYVTGDVMYDIFLRVKPDFSILKRFNMRPKNYYFATIHRQENTDNSIKLRKIIDVLDNLDLPVIFPVHPRTKKALKSLNLKQKNIRFIKPVKYSQSIALQKNAKTIITDSGGIQKEAYWLKVPCITLRDFTEWSETVSSGWNKLVGANKKLIQEAVKNFNNPQNHPDFYGEGNASNKIAEILKDYL